MDNNREETNIFSNSEDAIRQIVTESIQHYLSSNENIHNSRPNQQQIISVLRDIIRSGNTSLNNYNVVMRDFSRSMRESISLLQHITGMDNTTQLPRNQPPRVPQPHVPQPLRQPRTRSHLMRSSRNSHIQTNASNQTSTLPDLNNIFAHGLLPTISPNNIFTPGLFPTINPNNIFNNSFENVRVYPTNAQLENASETIFFNNSMELQHNQCPFTLDTFQSGDRLRRILHCGHIFSAEPFMRWFQANVQCPVCRFDIRTYNSSMEQPNNNTEQNNVQQDDIDIEQDGVEQSINIGYNNSTPIGLTASYTFTDASTMDTGSIVTNPINIGNTIETILHNALSPDLSNNIFENLSRYIISNMDSSNNNIRGMDSSNNNIRGMDSSNNNIRGMG